jgi:hypothetical protein
VRHHELGQFGMWGRLGGLWLGRRVGGEGERCPGAVPCSRRVVRGLLCKIWTRYWHQYYFLLLPNIRGQGEDVAATVHFDQREGMVLEGLGCWFGVCS